MTISLRDRHAADRRPPGQSDRLTGIALMTGSAVSNQLGAATAALAFPVLGPAGVVAVRQWVACAVLLGSVRPRFRSFTRRAVAPGAGPGADLRHHEPHPVQGDRPDRARPGRDPGVPRPAVGGAAGLAPACSTSGARWSPAPPSWCWPGRSRAPTTLGIALALLAAACWAGYILVNRVDGPRLPGAQGPAAAASLSALLYVPVGIWVLASHPVTAVALGRAASAGVLCSAVPMVADLLALRRVPARFFGVFMSVNPVFAALTGLVILGQPLGLADWLAIAAIVTANAVSVSTARRDDVARVGVSAEGAATG